MIPDDSKAFFAIIRHNVRTYASGGVVAVIKGKQIAETAMKGYENGQGSEDRHEGWRYFLEKTKLKPGINPAEATQLRQMDLEVRESKAQQDNPTPPFTGGGFSRKPFPAPGK